MDTYQTLTLVLGVLTVLIIPLLVLVIRSAIRWSRIEWKINALGDDIKDVKADMRDDRTATNKRLTWLEQNLWRRFGSALHNPTERG